MKMAIDKFCKKSVCNNTADNKEKTKVSIDDICKGLTDKSDSEETEKISIIDFLYESNNGCIKEYEKIDKTVRNLADLRMNDLACSNLRYLESSLDYALNFYNMSTDNAGHLISIIDILGLTNYFYGHETNLNFDANWYVIIRNFAGVLLELDKSLSSVHLFLSVSITNLYAFILENIDDASYKDILDFGKKASEYTSLEITPETTIKDCLKSIYDEMYRTWIPGILTFDEYKARIIGAYDLAYDILIKHTLRHLYPKHFDNDYILSEYGKLPSNDDFDDFDIFVDDTDFN